MMLRIVLIAVMLLLAGCQSTGGQKAAPAVTVAVKPLTTKTLTKAKETKAATGELEKRAETSPNTTLGESKKQIKKADDSAGETVDNAEKSDTAAAAKDQEAATSQATIKTLNATIAAKDKKIADLESSYQKTIWWLRLGITVAAAATIALCIYLTRFGAAVSVAIAAVLVLSALSLLGWIDLHEVAIVGGAGVVAVLYIFVETTIRWIREDLTLWGAIKKSLLTLPSQDFKDIESSASPLMPTTPPTPPSSGS